MGPLYPLLGAAAAVMLPVLLAAFIAGTLTYFDLDTVFDEPPPLSWGPWFRLVIPWWGFVLSNVVLAVALYFVLKETTYFNNVDPWLNALCVGFGYPALVRLKFTTFTLNGKAIPIGVDTVYEGLKDFVHKRINRVIREWRMEQIGSLAQSEMTVLRQKAKALVVSDELMSNQQRKMVNVWIEQTAAAEGITDDDRRLLLATFIVTGGQTRAIS